MRPAFLTFTNYLPFSVLCRWVRNLCWGQSGALQFRSVGSWTPPRRRSMVTTGLISDARTGSQTLQHRRRARPWKRASRRPIRGRRHQPTHQTGCCRTTFSLVRVRWTRRRSTSVDSNQRSIVTSAPVRHLAAVGPINRQRPAFRACTQRTSLAILRFTQSTQLRPWSIWQDQNQKRFLRSDWPEININQSGLRM